MDRFLCRRPLLRQHSCSVTPEAARVGTPSTPALPSAWITPALSRGVLERTRDDLGSRLLAVQPVLVPLTAVGGHHVAMDDQPPRPLPPRHGRERSRCKDDIEGGFTSPAPTILIVVSRRLEAAVQQEDRSSPHPCGPYGSARPARMRDSMAVGHRSLIRPPWPVAATRDENRACPAKLGSPWCGRARCYTGDFPFRMRWG
jgi:hypothetical protein